jgi:uncharacterized protein YciI
MAATHHVLIYDYVENALEARAPHRESHLALVKRYLDDGKLTMAGAIGDPPTGGLLVFNGADTGTGESFTREDPYVTNGVVTSWRVEPWTVVT